MPEKLLKRKRSLISSPSKENDLHPPHQTNLPPTHKMYTKQWKKHSKVPSVSNITGKTGWKDACFQKSNVLKTILSLNTIWRRNLSFSSFKNDIWRKWGIESVIELRKSRRITLDSLKNTNSMCQELRISDKYWVLWLMRRKKISLWSTLFEKTRK